MPKKKLSTQEYSYTVIYEPIKNKGFQITVPLLPSLITFGRNFEEAQEMARDAVRCHLGGLQKIHS